MLYGDPAVNASGMPLAHGVVFSNIARHLNCVIISRSVGKYATQLIQENYATKGFHVKAKSCNWGPMAGFVLADPRFSKYGADNGRKVAGQQRAINDAIHHGAGKAGLYITEERRLELINLFNGDPTTTYNEVHVLDNEKHVSTSKGGTQLDFVLKRQLPNRVPGGGAKRLWAVCYRHRHQHPDDAALGARINTSVGRLYQVMGLTDPRGDRATKATYRGVMTGDYDLWGCFPREANYDPDNLDRRRVRNSNNELFNFGHYERYEHRHIGNMSRRLRLVRDRLNAGFRAAGYQGGNMVHHSDEAGRPMVDNIEVDAVAFFPTGERLFFSTTEEYKDFIQMCRTLGFKTLLNAWWHLYKEMNQEQMDNVMANRNHHLAVLSSIKAMGARAPI
ncbi:CyaA/EF/ExoY family adenylyl cyclase toxin [Vibrio sp. S4M6]|uniref:CyaA/EF/ExoY family adenylyl cyclase toxin n=1 Tax=Vibrio sinus TaxID=2946865 RepID=UPI002029EDAB|nr:CyaA/EF/ExoY family adenylyl cyclase toxin [Vibrio sinus]MCL9780132.1 CyaA/EF/ExoY family adenylyl cyclase toxin [Vibrio sinus]